MTRFFDGGVEDEKLCVTGENALEGTIGVDDLRRGQPLDGLVVAEDKDFFPIIFEQMMFFFEAMIISKL